MKTRAIIEKRGENDFCIYTPDLTATIIGEGATIEEAKADFENSVKEVLDTLKGEVDKGDLQEVEFVYQLADEPNMPL